MKGEWRQIGPFSLTQQLAAMHMVRIGNTGQYMHASFNRTNGTSVLTGTLCNARLYSRVTLNPSSAFDVKFLVASSHCLMKVIGCVWLRSAFSVWRVRCPSKPRFQLGTVHIPRTAKNVLHHDRANESRTMEISVVEPTWKCTDVVFRRLFISHKSVSRLGCPSSCCVQ